MAAKRIRVLAADHNALLREGLAAIIQVHEDMELVAVVESNSEAVRIFRYGKPDVVLIDLDLPLPAGVDAIRRIRQIDPEVGVLGLCTYEDSEVREQALRAGASRFMTKDMLTRDLIEMIRQCCSRRAK